MARVSIIQELVDAGDVGQSDAILPRGNDAKPFCAGRSSVAWGMHGFNEVGASKEGNQVKREDEVDCFWMGCGLSSFLNHWLAVDISVD